MSEDQPSPGGAASPEATFDLGVFVQGTMWRDDQGWEYPVSEMTEDDLSALRSWLRENSKHFYVHSLRKALVEAAMDHLDQWMGPSVVGADELPELVYLSHIEWLEGSTLMKALRGL